VQLRFGRTLWLLFTLFVIYGSTIPFDFVRHLSSVGGKLERLADNPLMPKGTPQDWSAPDILQNFLLFVPFGVLGVLAVAADARSGMRRVVYVTALGAALACGVEALQLFTRNRTSSLADALTNTLGAGVGAIVAYRLRQATHGTLNHIATRWLSVPSSYPVIVATVMVCVLAWVPFDVTLDVGMILPKIGALKRNIWQYTGLTDEGAAIIQFALLAVAISAWLAELNQRWAAVKAAAIVIVAALGLEASQIIITSRMPGLEDIVVRSAGGVVGAFLWTIGRRAPYPLIWLALLIVATAGAAALHGSGAPEILATRRLYRLLNLRHYEGTAVPDFIYLVERMCVYFPTGFVVARVVNGTARAVATAMIIAAVIAIGLEAIAGNPLDWPVSMMDIAASVVGAGLGAYVATAGASSFNLVASRQTAWSGE
jgi:VanZ family protein